LSAQTLHIRAASTPRPEEGNTITAKDLPDYLRHSVEYVDGTDGKSIRKTERSAVVSVLREFRGDRRLAARRFGISEAILYRRLKEHGITSGDPR
jgi:transcriptional regulator of acetoin/glycerol metabolism